MFSRCIAILVSSMLPMFAATLPLGPAHEVSLMLSGIVATLLCFGALSDNRFRYGVAVIGGWVALSPYVLPSTLLEEVVTVSSGVAMFVAMIGPFSEPPRVSFHGAPATTKPEIPVVAPELARAA